MNVLKISRSSKLLSVFGTSENVNINKITHEEKKNLEQCWLIFYNCTNKIIKAPNITSNKTNFHILHMMAHPGWHHSMATCYALLHTNV